jgi:hypothetical protein
MSVPQPSREEIDSMRLEIHRGWSEAERLTRLGTKSQRDVTAKRGKMAPQILRAIQSSERERE